MDGKHYPWNNWEDVIATDGTSQVWASHADQFYKGMREVPNKRIGKGQVTYIGIDPDSGELERDVMRKIYACLTSPKA